MAVNDTTVRPRRLLTTKETCARLDCSENTLRRLKDSGEIAFIKMGNRVRFDPRDVEAYIARHRVEAVDEWDL